MSVSLYCKRRKETTIAAVVVFKCSLEMSNVFGEGLGQELLNFSFAVRFLSVEPRLGVSQHEIEDSFRHDIDSYSFLFVGSVEAVFPGKVSDDAVALNNVDTSCK